MILRILLYCILGILIAAAAILLLVLFFPVRYRFECRSGSGEEEEKLTAGSFRRGLFANAGAGWLFGLLKIRYLYQDGKGQPELRILGIRVRSRRKAKNGTDSGKRKKKAKKKRSIGLGERLSQLSGLYDKIEARTLSNSVSKILQKGIKLIRGLLPRRLYAEGIIGTGDPADTGKVFMVAGLLGHIAGSGWRLQLEPDMDKARIRLDAGGSGRVFVFRILLFVLWFMTDRDIAIIRRARREAAGKKEHERTEGKPLSGTDHLHDGERAGRADDPDSRRGTAAGG